MDFINLRRIILERYANVRVSNSGQNNYQFNDSHKKKIKN